MILCTLVSLYGCLDDDTKQDWSEIVNLYVSSETGEYRPFGSENTLEGMKIKEKENESWAVIHFQSITGFTYEKGYNYLLKVEKIHLGNPPADGSDIDYKLIEILSKE